MAWTSITLYKDDTRRKQRTAEYWTMRGKFSNDLMAGLITAGTLLMESIGNVEEDFVYVLTNENGLTKEVRTLEDYDVNLIEKYRHTEDTIGDIYPETKRYGIWVARYGDSDYYDFITIDRADEFMQGFISMANAFKVDFRDYILGPPFDADGTEYDVVGYNIEPYFVDDNGSDEEEEYDRDD